ncbi:MAG: cupin domain-containing protein [Acidobacteriota bacterium]|nr:cupin domain-containing protein [Acidobacteriota bacterium]
MQRIDLAEKFSLFTDRWQPRIVAELNGQHVKIARIQGEFIWHDHPDEDEMFFVVKGAFRMELRDRSVELSQGDMFVVPRGVEHRPVADEECWIMMIEPKGTVNTGAAGGERTVEAEWV